MADQKHTPGPWEARDHHIYCEDTNIHICDICRAEDGDWSPANATLIASAPEQQACIDRLEAEKAELLEVVTEIEEQASKAVVTVSQVYGVDADKVCANVTHIRNKARAAIAKTDTTTNPKPESE